MLGGQACIEPTKDYVRELLKQYQQQQTSEKVYLFVFCGGQANLFQQIHDIAIQENAHLSQLKIIPLAYQTDEEVAPILARSNISITKSGGLTSMELQSVAHGRVLIHASEKYIEPGRKVTEEELLEKGMPIWEAGNARYLQASKKAQIVTPAIFAGCF